MRFCALRRLEEGLHNDGLNVSQVYIEWLQTSYSSCHCDQTPSKKWIQGGKEHFDLQFAGRQSIMEMTAWQEAASWGRGVRLGSFTSSHLDGTRGREWTGNWDGLQRNMKASFWWLISSKEALSPEGSFQNGASDWEPTIQTHGPRGNTAHPNPARWLAKDNMTDGPGNRRQVWYRRACKGRHVNGGSNESK